MILSLTGDRELTKKLLDVGQCDADHSRISALLDNHFEVEVHRVHSHDEAVKLAKDTTFQLIMINRLLDADGSPGMDVLNSLQGNPATESVPVMIVSNYQEAQDAAMKVGAVQGFGKDALGSPETVELLRKFVG